MVPGQLEGCNYVRERAKVSMKEDNMREIFAMMGCLSLLYLDLVLCLSVVNRSLYY